MIPEAAIGAAIGAVCPRVYVNTAPVSIARPYVIWQLIGGGPLTHFDGAAADLRHRLVQVAVWADTALTALETAHAIDEALRASSAFTAIASDEVLSDFDADIARHSAIQTFDIWLPRTP